MFTIVTNVTIFTTSTVTIVIIIFAVIDSRFGRAASGSSACGGVLEAVFCCSFRLGTKFSDCRTG